MVLLTGRLVLFLRQLPFSPVGKFTKVSNGRPLSSTEHNVHVIGAKDRDHHDYNMKWKNGEGHGVCVQQESILKKEEFVLAARQE